MAFTDHLLECRWEGRFYYHGSFRHWVIEGQFPGVQAQPTGRIGPRSVSSISNNRTSESRHMNANLVFPARFQRNFNK